LSNKNAVSKIEDGKKEEDNKDIYRDEAKE
jgi:hypothetical protein